MAALIIGSSNAGKSTYIRKVGYFPVAFGHQLHDGDVPAGGAIHYNLLHHALILHSRAELQADWDLLDEPILSRIVGSHAVDRAKVIVAPIADLRARASRRQHVEPGLAIPGDYPRHIWSEIFRKVDLFTIHDRLLGLLDDSNIPFDVLYSAPERGVFHPSDRARIRQHLTGHRDPVDNRRP